MPTLIWGNIILYIFSKTMQVIWFYIICQICAITVTNTTDVLTVSLLQPLLHVSSRNRHDRPPQLPTTTDKSGPGCTRFRRARDLYTFRLSNERICLAAPFPVVLFRARMCTVFAYTYSAVKRVNVYIRIVRTRRCRVDKTVLSLYIFSVFENRSKRRATFVNSIFFFFFNARMNDWWCESIIRLYIIGLNTTNIAVRW